MHVSYEYSYGWLILKSANFIDSISPELAKFPTEISKRRRCDKMIYGQIFSAGDKHC
jgi:hypothetical protein